MEELTRELTTRVKVDPVLRLTKLVVKEKSDHFKVIIYLIPEQGVIQTKIKKIVVNEDEDSKKIVRILCDKICSDINRNLIELNLLAKEELLRYIVPQLVNPLENDNKDLKDSIFFPYFNLAIKFYFRLGNIIQIEMNWKNCNKLTFIDLEKRLFEYTKEYEIIPVEEFIKEFIGEKELKKTGLYTVYNKIHIEATALLFTNPRVLYSIYRDIGERAYYIFLDSNDMAIILDPKVELCKDDVITLFGTVVEDCLTKICFYDGIQLSIL